MNEWVKAGGGGEWSRRRFLLQTAKFSALALLGSPLLWQSCQSLQPFQTQSRTTF
jgi:hypothetical protein